MFNYGKLNKAAMDVMAVHANYIIGGSHVINPDTANDIDILVHEFRHEPRLLTKLGFRALRSGDEKYDEIDHMRLIAVYENTPEPGTKKVNVIIVGAIFWPAYVGAVHEMRSCPAEYAGRAERIELHRGLCRRVAKIAQVTLPDTAF